MPQCCEEKPMDDTQKRPRSRAYLDNSGAGDQKKPQNDVKSIASVE